jgi:ABC-type bacteriocin/lantibiotic exporter with double-glycine peptidase domain
MLGARSKDIDSAEIEKVVYASNIEEFLFDMPAGIKTYVGEAGSMLSGGQKQRIAIARGLLKNTKIMIMDEPTSALDSRSENFIKSQLREITKGSTVLMVTHKLSMLTAMDDVFVVDAGTVKNVNEYGGLETYIHYLQSHEIA